MARASELDAQGLHEQAVATLRGAADAGHAEAATALGLRLLVGRQAPFEPQEGLKLLTAAAQHGEPGALAQMATLKAAGAWMPQNWDEALGLVQKAAELGSVHARGQLLILAGDRALVARARGGEANLWGALRQSVDLNAWRTPPQRRALCEAPRIRAVEKFVPAEVCAWLIARGEGKFERSLMFDGQKSNVLDSRTCSDFKFDIVGADLVLQVVRERVSAITTMPVVAFEPPQIFHYALGEEIKAHYDALRLGNQGYGQGGAYKGDRIATFLLYLNDDYDGGELEFPKIGLRHKGKTGDGIYFAHVDVNGTPEKLSLHAATPVTRNEKFILSQWIHDRPFTAAV
ncbi:MAG: 2OG-Fe(II) oxygenase [Alphaproteobacteria bacterium]|nr:2OG-Fe(II) oxygenase [Alphaproteobacteria bacterium]